MAVVGALFADVAMGWEVATGVVDMDMDPVEVAVVEMRRSLPRPLIPLLEFLYRIAKYSQSSRWIWIELWGLFTDTISKQSHQNKFHASTLKTLTQKFASFREGDEVSPDDRI